MNKVLCSTGTFINGLNNFDYTLIKELSQKINCDGYEFMIEPFWNSEEKMSDIVSCFLSSGINIETIHMDKNIGDMISKNEAGDIDRALRVFELNCKAAEKLGAKLLVLHLWGGMPSDKHIDVNIKTYADLLDIAGKYNVMLTVENIVCNTFNALTHMEKLYKTYGDNMKFTIDTRQAEFHKSLKATCEADFLWENNLVPHIHIADYKGDFMDWSKLRPVISPMEGDVDFDCFSIFLKSVNYTGSFTLEAGARNGNENDFDKINKNLDFIYKMAKD